MTDNLPDFFHTCILHNGIGNAAITRGEAETDLKIGMPFEVFPVMEFRPIDDGNGYLYTATRRVGPMIWIRNNHMIFPTFTQNTGLYEEATEEKYFLRVALIKWQVPNDDANCTTIGWRHFSRKSDPEGKGRPDMVGIDGMDFLDGQAGNRPDEERRRNPGDWDVLVSQRPIARHAMEHLGESDAGVALMRKDAAREYPRREPDRPPETIEEDGTVTFSFVRLRPPPARAAWPQ